MELTHMNVLSLHRINDSNGPDKIPNTSTNSLVNRKKSQISITLMKMKIISNIKRKEGSETYRIISSFNNVYVMYYM